MSAYRHCRTHRLALDAATTDDLEDMFTLHADPRVWTHFPSGRHRDPAATRRLLVTNEKAWSQDGLGYWVLRLLADDPPGLRSGAAIGIAGCARGSADVWNLYYRLTPPAHGRGLAGEVAAQGMAAARSVEGSRPVVASLLEHNHASRRTAERLGLSLAWRGRDLANPDADAIRLLYADRALHPDVLDQLLTS